MHNYTCVHEYESCVMSTHIRSSSTCGITRDVPIPSNGKRGPRKHFTRFCLTRVVLPRVFTRGKNKLSGAVTIADIYVFTVLSYSYLLMYLPYKIVQHTCIHI